MPILPGDYTANALFLTGGNATTTGAMAAVAKDHFGAKTAAISVGAWKADGSHLFDSRFVDPTQPEFEWRFVSYGSTATRLFVFNTTSHG